MIPRIYFPIVLTAAIFGISAASYADYPLVSHRYAADPTGLEYNGRLYLYCSNDEENSTNGYIMTSITCFSTDDLKNWTDHGVVFQAPLNASWATYAWAPSVISNQNKLHLYFGNGASGIGVATSTNPAGPFTDAKGSSLINSATPGAYTPNQWYFDPCAFIDDDGQPYLYFGGSNPTNARVILLNTNLTSISGSAMPLTATNFFEASYLHKRGGTYYFTCSSTPSSGMVILCQTNSNPTSGFVPTGTVLANPPQNDYNNNHASFFAYQGAWFCAYHNRALAAQNGIPTTYKRNVALDGAVYNADGTIQQVICTTNGLAQLKFLSPYSRVEAETLARQSGIATEACTEGGMNVTRIENGDWIMVRGVDFGTIGASNFLARVAATNGGNIELHLDSTNGTVIGNCVVPVTGGTQTWATASCAVSNVLARNTHDLYLKFTGSTATNLFNVNWWQFQLGSSNATSATRFILKASDGYGNSSFSSIGNWVTNGTASAATTPPGSGRAYDTGPYTLRTPTTGASTNFAGDSLTLSPGSPAASGSLMLKGLDGATVVINNLIMSGGVLSQGVNTGSGGIEWVAGSMNVVSNSYVSGLGLPDRYIGISAYIRGTASLSNDCNVVYTGNNTGFTGPMIVGSGGAVRITDQSNLGGNPTTFNAAQLLLNNGTLAANNMLALNDSNRGITLGSGGGIFTNVSGAVLTVSNVITGSGALTFNGGGSLVLAATNTYTGATVINGGRVSFVSPKTGNGNITLADGTTLSITASGTQITPATMTLGTSAAVTLEFNGITNTTVAPIAAGSLSAGGAVVINIRSGTFVVGQSYPLLTWTSGTAPTVVLGTFAGSSGNVSTGGNTIWLSVTPAGVQPTACAKIEAESGTLGSEFAISNSSSPVYITDPTDGSGYNPGSAARVASYTLVFPCGGTYELYARVRVGSGTYGDDSLFCGNGFGVKNPTNDSDWVMVNGFAGSGFTAYASIVTGGGTAGSGVWKWINLSQFSPGLTYTVSSESLVQTFQIGARENGLDIDAFVFGLSGMTFTVSNLNAGVDGTPLPDGVATVNWNDTRQQVNGFGGGVVFLDSGLDPVTDANMNALFGTNSGQLALTLLRVRIDPSTNWSTALSDAQKAVARGAGVLATPWTPPASMKDNNALTNGSLLPAQYANYAAYLKKYADYMASNNAPLRAISVQNEPDWATTYESCVWSSNQFLNFFRTNAAAIGSTPVMMPESLGFNFNYSDPTLNDSVAVTNVDLIGGHLYGVTTIQDYPNAHNKGKPTWMTEYLENDQTIVSAIGTAKQIHDCLTTGNMSAYIWWKCLGDANGLVDASGVIQKRGYVMSQFSRFVRPNDYRIGATNVGSGYVSAYKNTNSSQFAIVAINNFSFTLTQTITLTNFSAVSVAPWITTASDSLAAQTAVVVSNGTFNYTMPPLSIVTFVGQLYSNSPPAFASAGNQTVNPGVTLWITNSVTDPDVPTQTLTFALLNSPTNGSLATVNATNAVFTWRPLVGQADSTNTIRVKVTDSGTPNLSATNSFIITVNPVSQPALSTITLGVGQVTLTGSGLIGPDYTLLTSTNLAGWQALFTTNPTVMPLTLTVTNLNDPARYYRFQIGP